LQNPFAIRNHHATTCDLCLPHPWSGSVGAELIPDVKGLVLEVPVSSLKAICAERREDWDAENEGKLRVSNDEGAITLRNLMSGATLLLHREDFPTTLVCSLFHNECNREGAAREKSVEWQ